MSGQTSRVAVVTGGASGIGLGAARQLAADGHRVAVLDLNGAAAKSAADELSGAIGVEADVADRASVDAAFALVRAELGAMPRAVNFVSGPSRTGDIEQTIVVGAHGPFRVHIIVVG